MNRLYNIVEMMEPYFTPAAIALGAENTPSTETLNFLLVTKEAISLMRHVENSNSHSLVQ
jgi:hypothetical protein